MTCMDGVLCHPLNTYYMNNEQTGEVIKTRYSSKDISNFNPEYTLGDVIEEKIQYLLEKAHAAPHVIVITKMQLLWSDKPFIDLDKEDIRRVPLFGSFDTAVKHIPGRRPTKREQRKQVATFGIALEWPHKSIMDLLQAKFSQTLNKFIRDNNDVLPAPFKKYYAPDGSQKEFTQDDPLHFPNYLGYVLIHKGYSDQIKEFLMSDETPLWMKYQFEDAKAYTSYAYKKRILKYEKGIEATEQKLLESVPVLNLITTNIPEDQKKLIGQQYVVED